MLRLTSGLTSCLHLHCPHTHSPASGPEQTNPLGPKLHRIRSKAEGRGRLFAHLADPSLVHIRAYERHRSRVVHGVALASVTNPVGHNMEAPQTTLTCTCGTHTTHSTTNHPSMHSQRPHTRSPWLEQKELFTVY